MYEPILEARRDVLTKAYQTHPERFVKGPPRIKELPKEVWINKPVHANLALAMAS